MMMDQEKKNRNRGLIASAGIHVAVFLLLFFFIAWRAPNPPLPEYGIQLNFGLNNQGSGDIQPKESTDNSEERTQPEEKNSGQTKEDIREDARPNEVKEDAEEVASKIESPVSVKEQKKENKTEVQKEKQTESKSDPAGEYKKDEKKDSKSDIKNTESKSTTSQGDNVNKTGDKGNSQGSLDTNALYDGNQGGGGGGLSLSMSGWAWADQPKIPDLPDNADGRIVFEIECDADGEIVGIATLERGLSPRAEQLLKEEIRQNSLIRTSTGKVPERSKGRVVFLLKTK